MAKTALVFLTKGFEEIEALAVVDILRRGGVDVKTVSLDESGFVEGAHNIIVNADCMFANVTGEFDALVLPGGPGHTNYFNHDGLKKLVENQHKAGKIIAAICAAPTFLGAMGILSGKKAVCFPGMEDGLKDARLGSEPVEQDGNIITSKCPVTALSFGLYLVKVLMGDDAYKELYDEMHFELMGKIER